MLKLGYLSHGLDNLTKVTIPLNSKSGPGSIAINAGEWASSATQCAAQME